MENKVDFKDSRTMLIAGVPSKFVVRFVHCLKITSLFIVIIGAGMHTTLRWGNFQLDGIGLSTYTAIILNQILRRWNFANMVPKTCFAKSKKPVTDHISTDSSSVATTVAV